MFDKYFIPIFRKALALAVIAALLSMPLGALTGAPLFAPIQDSPLEVAFTANHDDVEVYFLLKTAPELSFSLELARAEQLQLHIGSLPSPASPAGNPFPCKDVFSRIFVPPRIIS